MTKLESVADGLEDTSSMPNPRTILHAEAELGSSVFDIRTENCDAVQLLGMAEVLHALGMQALAANQTQQMSQHGDAQRNILAVAHEMPRGGRVS